MNIVEIEIIDNVYAKIHSGISLIKPCLSYEAEAWYQTPKGKRKKIYNKSFIDGNLIYIGLLDRIEEFCKKRNIPCNIYGEPEWLEIENHPSLPGITFRDYQEEAIKIALEKQRGIIHAATGSGKTAISAGIISCFNNPRVLFLCPTIDLVSQTYDEFTKFGFIACKLGGGNKEITTNIVISTIQTYSKLDLNSYIDYWDIVLVDEVHRALGKEATIEKILKSIMAPLRIGLTATIPKEKEKQMVMEGLIGNVIYDVSAKRGVETGILATPHIKFIKIPFDKTIDEKIKIKKTYKAAYQHAIVENKSRNKLIALKAKEIVSEGKSVIIFVVEIAHLDLISQELTNLGVDFEKVHGIVEGEERDKIKQQMISGEKKCVVSSISWTTGVNIKNLDAIILAGGGKSEIGVIQSIGRCLRITEEKNDAYIYDCIDHYRYVAEHLASRINTYLELNWI